MKHLKKLSVVLMMTTLFSISFTSCIDTEVSPLVEGIYEAQADLIAAQTAVQNAEAALRQAQANAEQANADWRTAQAAKVNAITAGIEADNAFKALKREQQILVIIAEANLAVAEAQNNLEKENLKWQIKMAELMAELEAAGVQLAVDYAYDYRNAMNAANAIQEDLLEAKDNLADAELMVVDPDGTGVGTEVSYAYHLAMLQNSVDVAQANVDDTKAKLDLFNDYAEDPIAAKELLDAQVIELRAEYEALQQQRADQVEAIGLIQFERDNRNAYVTEIEDALGKHNTAVGQINDRLGWIENAQDDIEDYQAAIDNYDSIKTTLEAAVEAAEVRIGAEEADNHPSNHAPGTGLLGDIETLEESIGTIVMPAAVAGDTPIASPDTLYEALWNADLEVKNAEEALSDHQTAFAALTASYNAAASAYASAQATFDAGSFATDLTNAQDAVTNFQTGGFQDAVDAYDDAKLAFEANPAGDQVTDTDGNHSISTANYLVNYNSTFDLGETGIHSDIAPDTYMRVLTWKETTLGSNDYIPATLEPTKYNTADLAAYAASLIADVAAPNTLITANSQIYLWEDDDAPSAMPINDLDGNPAILTPAEGIGNNADLHAFGPTDGGKTQGALPTLVVFINVESDDDTVSNEIVFNAATNMLGTDDFNDRDFIVSTGPIVWEVDLTPTDANAGYNSATPETLGGNDTLTAQAELWNLKLAEAKAQYAYDNADDILEAAEEAYLIQKELFDNGVATEATLEAAVTTAEDNRTNGAAKDLSDAMDDLAALQAELGTEYLTTPGNRELNNGELPLTWDIHANDGLAIGDEEYDYDGGSAGWDSNDDGDYDSLTAYAELWNAQEALAIHTETTLAQYETMISNAEANIAEWESQMPIIQARLDANLAIVTEMLPMLTELGIEYTFEFNDDGEGELEITNDTIAGSSYADLRAEIIAANKILWDIDRDIAIVQDKQTMVDTLITSWNSSYNTFVNTTIPNLEASLITAETDLEEAKAALALAKNDETAATANLAYLQALIDTLEARHANALAIAERYKELMTEALTS